MDINTDQLRRDALATEDAHRAAMRPFRHLLDRLFGEPAAATPRQKADVVLNGIDRRRFMQIGGLSVVSAAVLAACGSDDEGGAAAGSSTTTTGAPSASDITILRTATSLENLAVEVYTRAIEGGLLTTAAVLDTAKLFRDQHKEHAELLKGATAHAGGEPFTAANPAVLQQLTPTIQGLRDQAGVVRLAYDLELSAAATYQATTGTFADVKLNEALMSIGGVEARHAAVLASVVGQPISPKAFATTERAVTPGTGV